jgi:hypothetical protein
MQNQQQLDPKGDIGSTTRHYGSSIKQKTAGAQGMSAGPRPLDMNGYIKRLTQSISPALKEEIGLRARIGGGALPVMADPARISAVFAALVACGSLLSGGGSVTILTALVPLDTGRIEKRTGNGCALLSFHIAGPRGVRLPRLSSPARDCMLPALFNVRHIVGRYHGCFRLSVSENAVVLNVYLPVVQRSSTYRARNDTAFGSAEEGL